MNGETDLTTPLKNMQPLCDRRMFVFCSVDDIDFINGEILYNLSSLKYFKVIILYIYAKF
jgi:hypothetical protein